MHPCARKLVEPTGFYDLLGFTPPPPTGPSLKTDNSDTSQYGFTVFDVGRGHVNSTPLTGDIVTCAVYTFFNYGHWRYKTLPLNGDFEFDVHRLVDVPSWIRRCISNDIRCIIAGVILLFSIRQFLTEMSPSPSKTISSLSKHDYRNRLAVTGKMRRFFNDIKRFALKK